jgi:hypothetical protein
MEENNEKRSGDGGGGKRKSEAQADINGRPDVSGPRP